MNPPSNSGGKYRPVLTASDISLLISKLSPEPSSPDEFRLRVYLQSFLLKSSGGLISPAYIPSATPSKYSAAGLGLSDDPSPSPMSQPSPEEIEALQKAISASLSQTPSDI